MDIDFRIFLRVFSLFPSLSLSLSLSLSFPSYVFQVTVVIFHRRISKELATGLFSSFPRELKDEWSFSPANAEKTPTPGNFSPTNFTN